MKNQIQSFLKFSKKELNGILVLFFLLLIIFAVPPILRLFEEPESYDLKRFQNEITAFKASASERRFGYNKVRNEIEDQTFKADYFDFDPNIISESDWKRLGLSEKQARVILKYRSKGGKFFKREDLKKIYSIREEQYHKLEPYIKIDQKPYKQYDKSSKYPAFTRSEKPVTESRIIELNTADSAALVSVSGIGPAFASRIIKFRNRLGGFYSKEQLKEVYGLDSAKYAKMHQNFSADASLIKTINVNSATFDDLKKQPYLTYKQTNAILQYRKQHGSYKSLSDLKQVVILNEEIIRKIGPYLSF